MWQRQDIKVELEPAGHYYTFLWVLEVDVESVRRALRLYRFIRMGNTVDTDTEMSQTKGGTGW